MSDSPINRPELGKAAFGQPIIHRPGNVADVQSIVRSHAKVLPIGGQSKTALSTRDGLPDDTCLMSLASLSGIVQYDPSEYTLTAMAGTPIHGLNRELASQGQSLPFDPVLASQGSTIGGTIASGLSGSGRFRFGGVRDFILGVEIITGDGERCVGGGKVVKNAAGFDVPKLMVGSLGRLGVITEVTMKVFPMATHSRTILVQCADHEQAVARMQSAARSPWDLDAIDYRPMERAIYFRIAGPESFLDPMTDRIESEFGSDATEAVRTSRIWNNVASLAWLPSPFSVTRVATNHPANIGLQAEIDKDAELHSHWSAAGGLVWVSSETPAATERLADHLFRLRFSGLTVLGRGVPAIIGNHTVPRILDRISRAMDPPGHFLPFPESTLAGDQVLRSAGSPV